MNSSNEQLQEKKAVLEQELKRINLELANVLNLNDTLALENKEKDETISQKEQLLIGLQEKDNQEIEQYLQERTCLEDSFSHEVDVINDSIKKLTDLKNKYDNLEAENALLSSSIEKIKKTMSSATASHAKSLHDINRNMRTMRQEMEATFRKELVEMDLHFQRQAFEAMDDEKKLAMLANSKLKDELALQSVGISNLGVRCGRDKQHFKDIKNKMKSIGQQVNARRTKLSDLQMKKMRSGLNICTFESELSIANEKETRLKEELDNWPSYDELDEVEANLEKVLASQNKQLQIWTSRMKKSQVLESDYKRSNFTCSDKVMTAEGTTSYNMSCADTLAQIKDCDYNGNLEEALQPIRGKESTLLPSEGTVSTCVAQIIQLLRSDQHAESCDAPLSTASSQVDPHFDLIHADRVKELIDKLQNTVRMHIADARISCGSSCGDCDDLSQISEKSLVTTTGHQFSGIIDDSKWLEKPQSFENMLATSNVKNIGKESKSKTKLTNVFVPEGVCMDPPVISNNLLEKVKLSASAPNLHSRSLVDDISVESTTSLRRRSKRSSKREDPLAVSKVKHSKRSLSTINLRAKDSKGEKIIQLIAKSCK